MATNHDEVNGYFIPAGTMVLGNSWYVDYPHQKQRSENLNSPTCPGESFTTQIFILNQAGLIQTDSWAKVITSISLHRIHSRLALGLVAGSVLVVLLPKHNFGSPLLVYWAFSKSVLLSTNWVDLLKSPLLSRVGWCGRFFISRRKNNLIPFIYFFSHPLPFKFSLKPRGDFATFLIEQTEFSWIAFSSSLRNIEVST